VRVPQYITAYRRIRKMMEDGHYRAGEKIPAMNRLAKNFKLTTISIRQAVDLLKKEGALRTVPKGGTYFIASSSKSAGHPSLANAPVVSRQPSYQSCALPARTSLRLALIDHLPFQAQIWQGVIAEYHRHNPYVRIVFDLSRENEAPDMLQIPTHCLDFYAEKDELFDLPALGDFDGEAQAFYPAVLAATMHHDTIMGIPVNVCPAALAAGKHQHAALDAIHGRQTIWSVMDLLAGLAKKKSPRGDAGLLISNFDIFDMLLLAGVDFDFYEEALDGIDRWENIVARLEPYMRNRRLMFQWPLEWLEQTDVSHLLVGEFFSGRSPFYANHINSGLLLQDARWHDKNIRLACFSPEKGGFNSLIADMISISKNTAHPLECAEFLRFLQGAAAQEKFAQAGIWTGRQDVFGACPALWPKSNWEELRTATLTGKAIRTRHRHLLEAIRNIINLEIMRWQRNESSAEELPARIKIKMKYWFAAQKNKERNSGVKARQHADA